MTGSIVWRVTRWLLLLLFAAFFAIPLLSMLDFSTQVPGPAPGRTGQAWRNLVADPALSEAIVTSLLLSLFTVVMMIALLVPTMVWVRLRVPRASRLVEYLCLLPLTIPALVIVVGISNVYAWVTYLLGDSALVLTFAYVVSGAAVLVPGHRRGAVLDRRGDAGRGRPGPWARGGSP